MAIDVARAALRVTHQTLPASEVSVALGLAPTESHEIGSPKSSERVQVGRRIAGRLWEHSFWLRNGGLADSANLEAHLRQLADEMLPRSAALEDLATRGFEMTWACFVSQDETGQGGLTLSPPLLRDLGSLPVALWLDIYA